MISNRTEFQLEAGAATKGALLAQAGSKTGAASAVAAVGGMAGVPGAEHAATLLSTATMGDAALAVAKAPAQSPGMLPKIAAMSAEGGRMFLAGLKLNMASLVATQAAGLAYDIAHPPDNVQHVQTTKLLDEYVTPHYVSDQAYNAPDERSAAIPNTSYRLDAELSTEESAVYYDPVHKHALVGFRGTVITNPSDVLADGEIGISNERTHRRYQEAEDLIRRVHEKYIDGTMSTTGHSLGGAIGHETLYRQGHNDWYLRNTDFNMGSSPFVKPDSVRESKIRTFEHKSHHVRTNLDLVSLGAPRVGKTTVHSGAKIGTNHSLSTFQGNHEALAHPQHQPTAQQPAQQPAQRQSRHPALQMAMHVVRHGPPTTEQMVVALSDNAHELISSVLPKPATDLLFHFAVHHAIKHHTHHHHHHHHHHKHHHHKHHHKHAHGHKTK